MTHFYLTLLSNASIEYYPNNKPQSFKTKLFKPLDLTKEDYEVALAEIQYPCTWYTIHKDSQMRIVLNHLLHGEGSINDITIDFKIPKGMYNSMDDVIKEINLTIKEKIDHFKLKIHPRTFKTIITKTPNPINWRNDDYRFISLGFTPNLCHILGFDTSERELEDDMIHFFFVEWGGSNTKDQLISKYPNDINRGMYTLFVYSDLVSSQAVGDAHAPLLRTVFIKPKLNTLINETFYTPHYIPIQKQIFDSIEIDIRDDTGELIPFTYGKVLLKLHFRLRRSPYFE